MDIFRVPNEQDTPSYPLGAAVYSTIWRVLALARGGWAGVVSGCEVTESAIPTMTIDVASGRVVVAGTGVDIAAETLVISSAHATLPRWDLVSAEDDGDLVVHTGIAATTPVVPEPAALTLGTETALARVFVPAATTAIIDDHIFSLSIPVAEPAGATTWTTIKATDQTTGGTRSNTATLANDSQLLFAMAANTDYAIRAHLMIATAGTTSAAKFGITGPASPTRVDLQTKRILRPASTDETGASMTVRRYTAYDTSGLNSPGTVGTWHIYIDGMIRNGSNTGNFALMWSQASAVVENTLRLNGSYLERM